jgi:UDP-N-acetylglucosamine:LPS N-acetylglucosamine transferase
MLMGVTSWELGVLRVPLIMVPDNNHTHLDYNTQFIVTTNWTKAIKQVD